MMSFQKLCAHAAMASCILTATMAAGEPQTASRDVFDMLGGGTRQSTVTARRFRPAQRIKPAAKPRDKTAAQAPAHHSPPTSPERAPRRFAPQLSRTKPAAQQAQPLGDGDVASLYLGGELSEINPKPQVVPASQVTPVDPAEPPSPSRFQFIAQEAEAIGVPATDNATTKPTAPDVNNLNRSLSMITIDTARVPESERSDSPVEIENLAIATLGPWEAPVADVTQLPARFCQMPYSWAAPAVFHRPLYFEQPNVERYGHYAPCCLDGCCVCQNNCLQSAICAAHFFASVPLLPCKVGSEPCTEHQYVLGAYRPGSCNPHRLVKPKCGSLGPSYQSLYTLGVIFFVP